MSKLQDLIVTQAMKDADFRQRLLNDPKGTLTKELGVDLPAGLNIQVHEESAATIHLVLPARTQEDIVELSDSELEVAVGGMPPVDHCGDGCCTCGLRTHQTLFTK